jgi:hypothetical protein
MAAVMASTAMASPSSQRVDWFILDWTRSGVAAA